MIAAVFEGGKRWVWKATDQITVNGQSFRLDQIEEFLVLEPDIRIVDGHITGYGPQVRGLSFVDDQPNLGCGATIVVPLDMESAKAVGKQLSEDKIAIVRSMPSGLRA